MDLTGRCEGMKGTAPFFDSFSKGTPLLVSDYDGTLAPFRKERGEAVPPPAVRELLHEILGAGGEVIVVSGRKAEEIAELLALPVEIWGCHGWERRTAKGKRETAPVPEVFLDAVDTLEASFSPFPPGAVERKPVSVALHWRGRSDVEAAYRAASQSFYDKATAMGLEMLPFSEGVEFRIPLFTKGRALQQIVNERSPEDPICYIGDDATDEDAFRVLSDRGLGVLVCDSPRSSAATAYIPLFEVENFLSLWRDALLKKQREEVKMKQ